MGEIILKGDFDWKKWFVKWGKGIGVTLIGTTCLYTASFMGVNPFPIEYAFWSGLLITFLNQIGNMLVHA
jgi:hypothetical protein